MAEIRVIVPLENLNFPGQIAAVDMETEQELARVALAVAEGWRRDDGRRILNGLQHG